MSTLRTGLALAGIATVLGAAAEVAVRHDMLFVPAGIVGGVVALLTVLERGRYRPALPAASAPLQTTGERFVDPATGVLTEVLYDERSGARAYRSR